MHVLLIFGGNSPEHEVSIRSAATIYDALSKNHKVTCAYISKNDEWGYVPDPSNLETPADLSYDITTQRWRYGENTFSVDVAFPIVHGFGGEDGALQRQLDSMNVAYVGTRAEESEVCFDKRATKELANAVGVEVVEDIVLVGAETVSYTQACKVLHAEVLFVKPTHCGSSIGVHRVQSEDEMSSALSDARQYSKTILVERAITNVQELEVGVLESEPGVFIASEPGEIVPDDEFYSYKAKYSAKSKSITNVSPKLNSDLRLQLKQFSLKINDALGCKGMVRVDFLYDNDRKKLYLSEVNTLPGFTSISMYPMLWANSGIALPELVDTLVRVASS